MEWVPVRVLVRRHRREGLSLGRVLLCAERLHSLLRVRVAGRRAPQGQAADPVSRHAPVAHLSAAAGHAARHSRHRRLGQDGRSPPARRVDLRRGGQSRDDGGDVPQQPGPDPGVEHPRQVDLELASMVRERGSVPVPGVSCPPRPVGRSVRRADGRGRRGERGVARHPRSDVRDGHGPDPSQRRPARGCLGGAREPAKHSDRFRGGRQCRPCRGPAPGTARLRERV